MLCGASSRGSVLKNCVSEKRASCLIDTAGVWNGPPQSSGSFSLTACVGSPSIAQNDDHYQREAAPEVLTKLLRVVQGKLALKLSDEPEHVVWSHAKNSPCGLCVEKGSAVLVENIQNDTRFVLESRNSKPLSQRLSQRLSSHSPNARNSHQNRAHGIAAAISHTAVAPIVAMEHVAESLVVHARSIVHRGHAATANALPVSTEGAEQAKAVTLADVEAPGARSSIHGLGLPLLAASHTTTPPHLHSTQLISTQLNSSHHTTPHHTTPHRTAPHHTTSHRTTPPQTELHHCSNPIHTKPHHTSPCHNSPHHTLPCHTTPHHTSPPLTTPHRATTHPTRPRRATPHRTTSYHISPTTPHHTTPRHTSPCHTTPHRTSPHLAVPQLTLLGVSAVDKDEVGVPSRDFYNGMPTVDEESLRSTRDNAASCRWPPRLVLIPRVPCRMTSRPVLTPTIDLLLKNQTKSTR